MERTKESKTTVEQYLDASKGNLTEAFKAWMQASTGRDYDALYPKKSIAETLLE